MRRRRRHCRRPWVLVVGLVTEPRKVTGNETQVRLRAQLSIIEVGATGGALNLCNHVARLAQWVAYDSCFSLKFERKSCCPTERSAAWFHNPSCFDGNPFGVGSYEVCCQRRLDLVRVPALASIAVAGCRNGNKSRDCTLSELLRSNCPDVYHSLHVVTYLEAPFLYSPSNPAHGGLQVLSARTKLPSWRLLLQRPASPLLGVVAEVWRRRLQRDNRTRMKSGRRESAMREVFLAKQQAGPPQIHKLPPALKSLATVARRGSLLATATSLLHAAVRLARAGEPVHHAVDTAERLVERWARRCGVGRRRLRHQTWAALLKQSMWPIFGLLHLLWDIRSEYSDLGGIDEEPGWRQLRRASQVFRKTSVASARHWPHTVDELGISRVPEWPDALDPVAVDAPSWSIPFLTFDSDVEVYGNKIPGTNCQSFRGLFLVLPEGATVLEVGAGTAPCRYLWAARPDIKYLTQDAAKYDISTYKKHGFKGGMFTGSSIEDRGYTALDIISDIAAIPLPDASVDVVMCDQVLEHVIHPVAAVREMARLLRIGGFLLIRVPYGPYLHNLPHHYNGGLTSGWFEHHLHEANVSMAWTAYRYTLPGRQLSRLGIAEQCIEAKQGTSFARLWRHLLLDVIPPLTDTLQASCNHALQRRPQGIAVAAVK